MANSPTIPFPVGKPTHKIVVRTIYFKDLPNAHVPASFENELFIQQDALVELLDEYIGFNGQWSKILHDGEIKYIKNTLISPLVGTKRRLRPKYSNRDIPNQSAPEIDWTEQPINNPYFYEKAGLWYVSVLIDYEGNGKPSDELIAALNQGLIEGTRLILKRNGKRNSEKYVKQIFDTFFFFSKVGDWSIPATQCKNIKVLVTLSNKYLISDEIESAISQNAIEEGEADYGAGSVQKASKFLKLDFTTLKDFNDQVANLGKVIYYYGGIQNRIGYDQIAVLKNTTSELNLQKYKEIVNLDLDDESYKLSSDNSLSLINTVKNHLISNGYDDQFLNIVPELTGINYNNIIFGFNNNFEICYLNVIKNNEFLNIKANEENLFSKNVGSGGLLSQRSGHLLYNLPNILNGQFKDTREEFVDWTAKYIIPPPNIFPETDKSTCVKGNIAKLREDFQILKATQQSLSASFGAIRTDKSVKKRETPTFDDVKDFLSGEKDRFYSAFTEYKYIDNITGFLSELDWKKFLIEALKCLLAQIPPEKVAELISKAGSIAQIINNLVNNALCNDIVNFITSIQIPVIPRYRPTGIDEAFRQIVKQAVSSVIRFALQAAFNKLLDLLKDCQNQNPLAPFGGLGLDDALDDLLNNPDNDNDPNVNNLYDGLGINGGNTNTDPDSQKKKDALKGIIADIGCFLNTNELCALFIDGTLTESNYFLIKNVLEKKYPILLDLIPNKQALADLFTKLGVLLNVVEICRDLTKMVEQPCIDCIDANQREKKALSNKDINPDEIDKILADLDNKRLKRAADLLDLLENGPSPANIPPILCGFDANGNPVKGLVNAANSDENFKNQFAGIIEGQLSEINSTFRKDFKLFPDNIAKPVSTVNPDQLKELTDPNTTDARKQEILAANGFAANKKKDGDDDALFFPVDPSKISNNISSITFDVAPNTRINLNNNENFYIDESKISFKIDTTQEAKQFKGYLAGSLDLAINAQINQAVKEFISDISNRIVNRLYVQIIDVGTAAIKGSIQLITSPLQTFGAGINTITDPKEWKKLGSEFIEYMSENFNKDTAFDTIIQIINDLSIVFSSTLIPGVPTLRQRSRQAANSVAEFDNSTLELDPDNSIITIKRTDENIQFFNSKGDLVEPTELDLISESVLERGSITVNPNFDSTQKTLSEFSRKLEELRTKTNFSAPSNYQSNSFITNILGLAQDVLLASLEFNSKLQGLTSQYLQAIEKIQLVNLSFSNFTLENKNKYTISGSDIIHKSDLSVFKYTIDENGPISFQSPFILDSSTYKIKFGKTIIDFINSESLLEFYTPEKSLQEFTFNRLMEKRGVNIKYTEVKTEIFNILKEKILASPYFYNDPETKLPSILGFNIIPSQIKGGNNARCKIYPSAMDMDRIKEEVVENFVNSACNFKIPDANRKQGDLTPAEESIVDSLVYTAIRVYLLDYYMKSLFQQHFSKFGQTKTKIMINFLASYMESDMKALNETYFNRFLDAAAKIYDRTYASDVPFKEQIKEVIEVESDIAYIKRQKLRKLIESQINFVSRVFSVYALPKTAQRSIPYSSLEELLTYLSEPDPNAGFIGEIIYEDLLSIGFNTKPQIYASVFNSFLTRDYEQKYKDFANYILNVKVGTPEYIFLNNFIFDIKEFLSVFAIYQNLCILANKNTDKTFKQTKNKIKGFFLLVTDTGGAGYRPENFGGNQGMSVEENLQNVDEDDLSFYIKAFIETPISILKGAAEQGDLNIFISSLPYRIIKPILLAARVENPDVYFGTSFTTLGLSLALSLTGIFTFNPTIIAGGLGWAYLALVHKTWLDLEMYKKKGEKETTSANSIDTVVDGETDAQKLCRKLKEVDNLRRRRFYGDHDEKLQLEEE